MKFIKQLMAVIMLLCATQALAESEMDKGYKLLIPPQPTSSGNKIEVLEFFFYGCSHCFSLHPLMTAWEKEMPKDVALTYVPAIFNPSWEPMARTFYALEALGQLRQLHDPLFKAWDANENLMDEASITAFVSRYGVNGKKFGQAYNSFSMQSKIVRAKQMGQAYGLRGTPTLVVDGKYLITGLHPPEAMEVLNEVIAMARKERSGNR